MPSVFTPALGSVTHVAYDDVKTSVKFTAKFTHAEYYDLKRVGGVVQVWTDIPVPGRERGWGPISFTETHSPAYEAKTTREGASELSLISVQDELEDEERMLSSGKTLSVEVDLKGCLGTYSFTYRILYPSSGGIWWLGEYGRNGTFVVETVVGAGQAGGVSFEPGWESYSGGWTRQVEGETTIGRVSPSKYRMWAIGNNGLMNASLQEASLLLLLPRPSCDDDVVRPASALVLASGQSSVSIKSNGTLLATGKGSIYVQSPADHNIERVLSLHSDLQHRVLSSSTYHNNGCVVLFSQTGAYTHPRHGLIFPSSCTSSSKFSVELPAGSLTTSGVDLALHSPVTFQTRLLSSSPSITITAASSGGSFILAPVYAISPNHLLLLTTPHVQVNTPLPTPPPSPLVRPVKNPIPVAPLPTAEHDKGASSEAPVDDPPLPSVEQSDLPSSTPPAQGLELQRPENPLTVIWREKSIRAFVASIVRTIAFILFVVILHRGQAKPIQPQSSSSTKARKDRATPTLTLVKEEEPKAEEATSEHDTTVTPEPSTPHASDDIDTKSDAGTDDTFIGSPPVPRVPEESLPTFIQKSTNPTSSVCFGIPPGLSHLVLLSVSSKGLHLDLNGRAVDADLNHLLDGVHETSIKTSTVSRLRISLSDTP